jgi:hypothetical protein
VTVGGNNVLSQAGPNLLPTNDGRNVGRLRPDNGERRLQCRSFR